MKKHYAGIVVVCLSSTIVALCYLRLKSSSEARRQPAPAVVDPSKSGATTPKTVAVKGEADEGEDVDAIIRATVTRKGPISGGELIDATLTSKVPLRPGWSLTVRVDECLRGKLDRRELVILCSHSPSQELGAHGAGGQLVLRLRSSNEPVTLYTHPDLRFGGIPDVSRVAYTVSRAKLP
jgi:hypothetical protein